jgi:hypothetical protein
VLETLLWPSVAFTGALVDRVARVAGARADGIVKIVHRLVRARVDRISAAYRSEALAAPTALDVKANGTVLGDIQRRAIPRLSAPAWHDQSASLPWGGRGGSSGSPIGQVFLR